MQLMPLPVKLHMLLWTALLSACAAPYSPPSSTNASRVRVLSTQTDISASVRAAGYAAGRCDAPMDLGTVGGIARWQASTTANMPGSSVLADKTDIERAIPAGTPYLIAVAFLSTNPVHPNFDENNDVDAPHPTDQP